MLKIMMTYSYFVSIGKNVLVHQDLSGLICVKLINFESSAIAGSVKDSMSTLPVHLFPPEVSECNLDMCFSLKMPAL